MGIKIEGSKITKLTSNVAHTHLSPSGFDMAFKCSAYSDLPSARDKDFTVKGQKGHDTVEKEILKGLFSKKYKPDLSLEGNEYISFVLSKAKGLKDGVFYLECPFVGNFYGKTIQGSPDAAVINHETKTIEIIDYKNGAKPVIAFENIQLCMYWSLIFKKHPEIKNYKAFFSIFQPKFENSFWELDKKFIKELDKDVKYVIEQEKQYVIGQHCYKCFKRQVCPAFYDEHVEALEEVGNV